jgi:hypothetical protein
LIRFRDIDEAISKVQEDDIEIMTRWWEKTSLSVNDYYRDSMRELLGRIPTGAPGFEEPRESFLNKLHQIVNSENYTLFMAILKNDYSKILDTDYYFGSLPGSNPSTYYALAGLFNAYQYTNNVEREDVQVYMNHLALYINSNPKHLLEILAFMLFSRSSQRKLYPLHGGFIVDRIAFGTCSGFIER